MQALDLALAQARADADDDTVIRLLTDTIEDILTDEGGVYPLFSESLDKWFAMDQDDFVLVGRAGGVLHVSYRDHWSDDQGECVAVGILIGPIAPKR